MYFYIVSESSHSSSRAATAITFFLTKKVNFFLLICLFFSIDSKIDSRRVYFTVFVSFIYFDWPIIFLLSIAHFIHIFYSVILEYSGIFFSIDSLHKKNKQKRETFVENGTVCAMCVCLLFGILEAIN